MRVLYVTSAEFTTANAASLRNVGLALSLVHAGHDVTIANSDDPRATPDPVWTRLAVPGLTIVSVGLSSTSSVMRRRASAALGRSHGSLGDLIERERPDVVILYQSMLPLLTALRFAARRHRAAFVLDMTEWYDGASLPLGRLGPVNAMNQLSMRFAVPRVSASISISERLAEHCGRRGARTLVVPPLFELSSVVTAVSSEDDQGGTPIRVAVTGTGITPGQKDRLGLLAIAEAVKAIDPAGTRVSVRVAGASRQAVEAELRGSVPASFDVLGRISWEQTLEVVSRADYTLLLRSPDHRRSMYGMPSKVPESLLLGTPILGNTIGDLDRHLRAGFNAMIVDRPEAGALMGVLGEIVEEQIRLDRSAIRADAQARFGPERYAPILDHFLHEVVRSR